MTPSSGRGNDPERWEKLLKELDDKLQLGLLDQLRKISSYHFENAELLLIEPSSAEQMKYLTKPFVLQQLEVFASESIGVKKVSVKSP
jgi:hypothetical protein